MRLLNKQESWDLLRDNVFCQHPCPHELEKAGKKIAENCEGLPLTIVAIAGLLSGQDKTKEYWNEVAENRNHWIFLDAYHGMSKVLLPSYTYLPRLLQMCFLFMGVFPQNQEVLRSKIVNLWIVDGFRELNVNIKSDNDADNCLNELVINNLVLIYQESTFNWCYTVKSCGLHSSLWHLSNKIAKDTKFCLALSSYNDSLGGCSKGGNHRLSFHNNVLFGIKDMHKSVEDNFVSTALSLLCYGPYHQYQVPICFGLKLLRELDALSIRFYEFPLEVLQLEELRYLTVTVGGTIPSSISQLSKLQFLIVERHFCMIKSCEGPSYLKCLSTLLNLGARSCTSEVLNAIPNLKELKVRVELAPDDGGKYLSCFAVNLITLRQLNSFKCVFVNPEILVPPRAVLFSSFPRCLFKLSLSGLGYPWKEMSKISSLRIWVLKLKNYAFRGAEWEVEEKGFNSVYSLVIEDADLVEWKFGDGGFSFLRSLRMKHCYKLQRVVGELGSDIRKLEVINCNPKGVQEVKWATRKKPEDGVLIQSSWNDLR